ncbi:MAG: hypothetical protein MUE34_08995 [Acidimicrobiales bacterium]|nr:hypothetical protein [Acidimicrobiales bacterium]
MSWAAHQFEAYALQAHLPKRWQGKISFLAIVVGDQIPDFIAKFWVYGFEFNGKRYGSSVPHEWHRGWPGAGFTHAVFFGLVVAGLFWLLTKNRAWALGVLLGMAAHAIVDINDSVGAMIAFPFSTENFSIGTWAYAATVDGGKYLDGAAYYSSYGFVMDSIWLAIVLLSWRVLTADYWRTQIVPADPRVWAWFGRRVPERVCLAIYRATFFYGLTRMIAWTSYAHVLNDYAWDLSWGGPFWMPKVQLSDLHPAVVLGTAALMGSLVYLLVDGIIRRTDPKPSVDSEVGVG